jgi:hypothetical protein
VLIWSGPLGFLALRARERSSGCQGLGALENDPEKKSLNPPRGPRAPTGHEPADLRAPRRRRRP